MARHERRILRHVADGVTWKVTPRGSRLAIEIVFDDEPDRVITRERVLTPHERATGRDALIAEQLADGFVLEPPWTPTPEWIGGAATDEIGIEVVETLYSRATGGLDLAALARTGAAPVRWSDARAAEALEDAGRQLDLQDRWIAWVREHAEDFATQPRPR